MCPEDIKQDGRSFSIQILIRKMSVCFKKAFLTFFIKWGALAKKYTLPPFMPHVGCWLHGVMETAAVFHIAVLDDPISGIHLHFNSHIFSYINNTTDKEKKRPCHM